MTRLTGCSVQKWAPTISCTSLQPPICALRRRLFLRRTIDGHGRDGCCQPPTGSPEAVARLRFPQNVACRFTAPRSSAVGSQHYKRLQLPVRETQFWLQQRCPFFDLVENVPS